MRIIHALKHCKHGHGNAHVAIDLACVQAQNGDEVIYASGGGDYTALLESQGVKIAPIVQETAGDLIRALPKFLKLCRDFKPDIIHAHMTGAAILGYVASRVTGAPLVTTVHNSFDPLSAFMRLGSKIVAVSEAERAVLIRAGVDPTRIATVLNGPNGSPRETFFPPQEDASPRRRTICTVCGLHDRKGVDVLLRAFALVADRRPEWTLDIAGQGPAEGKLKLLANELGIASRIRFLGQIGSPGPLLAGSDIFVVASYADPCCLAVCEARAAGCAIVATAVDGNPELLENGQAGLLVPAGDPVAMASELSKLMGDARELDLWRARARTGADYLSVDRLVKDYSKVYASALGVGESRTATPTPGSYAQTVRASLNTKHFDR